jgi:membrane protein YqaA with SNARE-associated domain
MHKVFVWVQSVLIPFLGPVGLFLTAFLDSSFLSLPEINDFLVVTSSALRPGLAWLYVAMTTLGSVVGCLALREIGVRGGEPWLERLRKGARRRYGNSTLKV